MSKSFTCCALVISVLSFFCLMSGIDFIVHNILYKYGLRFSYAWANVYWATYSSSFVLFSIIIGSTYWLASNRHTEDKRLSLTLIATVNLLMIGGLQDIMFFLFWGGGLPPNNVVWWWVPWNRLFGAWNSLKQVTLTMGSVLVTAIMWRQTFKKSKLHNLAQQISGNFPMATQDNLKPFKLDSEDHEVRKK